MISWNVNHVLVLGSKHERRQTQWTSNVFLKEKCWKGYVGAYIFKWNHVNAKIVYPQVVQKREGMLELGWIIGHKSLINVIRRGDHHGLFGLMS